MSFEITSAAEKFIRLMLRVDGAPDAGFRLAVAPGGCSGLSSDISVATLPAVASPSPNTTASSST